MTNITNFDLKQQAETIYTVYDTLTHGIAY